MFLKETQFTVCKLLSLKRVGGEKGARCVADRDPSNVRAHDPFTKAGAVLLCLQVNQVPYSVYVDSWVSCETVQSPRFAIRPFYKYNFQIHVCQFKFAYHITKAIRYFWSYFRLYIWWPFFIVCSHESTRMLREGRWVLRVLSKYDQILWAWSR